MRRTLSGLAALLAVALALPAVAEPRHGLSIFGDLKYPADFKHFDYVDPAAPKGGTLKTIGTAARGTFDTFNDFIVTGTAAQGTALLYDTLMLRAYDEPDAVYGLLAHSADVAADKLSVAFLLRPEARFADGTPVTADDVVFSFETLKGKGHPRYESAFADVVKAEAIDPLSVRFTFKGTQVRDLPVTIATDLAILPKAWYATRRFEDATLEPPLGSGPYRVEAFKPGSFVVYQRRPDYWGRDLPVNLGQYNFDAIRYEYYRDRTAQLEAFKAGILNLREEFSSRDWATGYDLQPVKDGRILKELLPDDNPSGTQGFFINLRRDRFKDPRVREAIGLAFDFEWTRKTIFFDQYSRVASYFENSDLKATGMPTPEELVLLEPWRGKLPDAAFGEAYVPPVSDGSGQDRKLIRRATALLKDAGYVVKSGALVGPDGKPFTLEFLEDDASSERFLAPFVKNLKLLGIDASIRLVDDSQYQQRLDDFDFDVLSARFVGSHTPGVDLRNSYSSASAGRRGTFNLAGIADPAVDDLVEKVIAARSRAELNTAARALDRVLRAGHYWVPQWYSGAYRIARWDVFGRPGSKPRFSRGVVETWWYDAAKAAKLGMN